MTSQNTPEDEIQTFTIDGHDIVEGRFNRFDDELIDRYFNEDGKAAIEQYVQRKVTEARLDEVEMAQFSSDPGYKLKCINELSQTLKEREER